MPGFRAEKIQYRTLTWAHSPGTAPRELLQRHILWIHWIITSNTAQDMANISKVYQMIRQSNWLDGYDKHGPRPRAQETKPVCLEER